MTFAFSFQELPAIFYLFFWLRKAWLELKYINEYFAHLNKKRGAGESDYHFIFSLMLHFSFVQSERWMEKRRKTGKAGEKSICKCICQVARRQFY